MQAWCGPNSNIEVFDRTGNQPCKAMVAAVCECHGLVNYAVEDYSIKANVFANFLRELRQKFLEEPLYLFVDNCSVHHSQEVKPLWEHLNIKPVWNLPYSPQYNAAVERYWSQLKSNFRPILLRKMLAYPEPRSKDSPLQDALFEAINKTPSTSIHLFVKAGLEELERDALEILKIRQRLTKDEDESVKEDQEIQQQSKTKKKSKKLEA